MGSVGQITPEFQFGNQSKEDKITGVLLVPLSC
jgi:hypothetical protein